MIKGHGGQWKLEWSSTYINIATVWRVEGELYGKTRPPVIWTCKTCHGQLEISLVGWWMGKNISQNIIYCQLYLENGCDTFVVYFRA